MPGHVTRQNGSLADGNPESEAAKFALSDKTPIDGVAHQFGVIGQLKLFEEAGSVGADGLHAEGQFIGDLRDCLAARDSAQDQMFTVGKDLMGFGTVLPAQMPGQPLSKRETDVSSAGQHFTDCGS